MSIKKICELTGYSYATVARALSNSGYCSKEKVEKIFEVANSINYKPNLSARTLRNNRTEKILFGIPDICNAFYFRMIQGATEEMEKNGYYPMIYNTGHSIEKELKLIELLTQKYADGLLMVSFDFTEQNIKAIRESMLPVVITNRPTNQLPDDNFDYIYSDHIKAMEIATGHLIDNGCRKIVLFTGAPNEQTSIERTQGFKNVLNRHAIEIDENYILDGGFTSEKALNAFTCFLAKNLEYDAIITANDLMCMGVMRCVSENNIDISHIRLLSFDNTDFAINLGITSIDLKQDLIGAYAVKLLLERIKYGRTLAKSQYIEPELIIRKSTRRSQE